MAYLTFSLLTFLLMFLNQQNIGVESVDSQVNINSLLTSLGHIPKFNLIQIVPELGPALANNTQAQIDRCFQTSYGIDLFHTPIGELFQQYFVSVCRSITFILSNLS